MPRYLHEHPEFPDFLTTVSNERNIRESIVEKDYWVAHVLRALASSEELKGAFLFKGGTSLSMGWGLLRRFSEDIDLLMIAPKSMSANKRNDLMKSVEELVGKLPGLTFNARDTENFKKNGSKRTSCFRYEKKAQGNLGTLLPYIKLEMGFIGGDHPQERRPIQAMLGRHLESLGRSDLAENLSAFEMPLLHARRTFAEKLFALHDAYHSGELEGKIRHYYDVAQLLGLPEVQNFLDTEDYKKLKENIAKFNIDQNPGVDLPKDLRMGSSKAFNLDADELSGASTAHSASDIYYDEKPSFERIMKTIKDSQERF